MAASSGPDVIDTGLVLALDAADRNSYPGSGTTWRDLSGRGNTNIILSNTTFVSGSIPYINFNGTNSYGYNFAANNGLTSGNTATIILWIYPNTTQPDATYSGMFALGNKSCTGQTLLFSMRSNRTLTMAKWCDDSTNGTLIPSANTWSMVSLVKNGGFTRFGINASTFQNAGNTGANNFSGTTLTIGCTDNPGRYYSGRISVVNLYNRPLTDTEIQQNFNALRGRFNI